MGKTENGIKFAQCYGSVGFLQCLPSRSFSQTFAVFHKSSWQCPEAKAWFNGSITEQNLILVDGYAANNHLRIFIVYCGAMAAYITRSVVALWNSLSYWLATLVAKIHPTIIAQYWLMTVLFSRAGSRRFHDL